MLIGLIAGKRFIEWPIAAERRLRVSIGNPPLHEAGCWQPGVSPAGRIGPEMVISGSLVAGQHGGGHAQFRVGGWRLEPWVSTAVRDVLGVSNRSLDVV